MQTIERAITRVNGRVAALEARAERWSWVRLAFFLGGILGSAAAYFALGAGAMWVVLILSLLAFRGTVMIHGQLESAISRYQLWREWQTRQLSRMKLQWEGLPPVALTLPPTHPFAHDLDIVGEHSLLRLLDTSVTGEGRARLLAWLTATETDRDETLTRQSIVQELAPRHRLRMQMAVNGILHRGRKGWTIAEIQEALKPGAGEGALWLWALGAWLLAWSGLVLLILNLAGQIPPYFIPAFVLYAMLLFAGQRAVGDMFQDALTLEAGLRPLSAVFELLERWSYRRTPALGELCQPFRNPDTRPSREAAKVMRVVNLTGARGNPLVWLLLNLALPYDFLVAIWFNRLRRELAAQLPDWMERWFTFEALSALANLQYLNPHYRYPTLRDEGALLAAESVGHPLLPDGSKVTNDFMLESLGTVNIITGSNMSGKSSFLKTLGVNLALAYAGGAVDAQSLSARFMRMFASMRVNDSVTDGISFFYAEVKRLKALLDALEAPEGAPLFFLIDEIFRGTNNRERLLGARAYTRALVGKRGAGFISTHDLELTRLAQESPAITNYHFRETIADGRMNFDYRLHPGPCPTTNALKIMALEGLPVEPSETDEAYAPPSPLGLASG